LNGFIRFSLDVVVVDDDDDDDEDVDDYDYHDIKNNDDSRCDNSYGVNLRRYRMIMIK